MRRPLKLLISRGATAIPSDQGTVVNAGLRNCAVCGKALMPVAARSGIVAGMSTISELPSGKTERAELAFVAREDPSTGSALDTDDEDWDDSAEAPMHRESPEAYADSIFPGYPLS